MSAQWPSGQTAWHQLAADWIEMQREARSTHWENLKTEEAADAALFEPMDPEEEETLF